MSKPAVFHPFSTNTGQILLNDLISKPRSSTWLRYGPGGTGLPVAPLQLDTSLTELALLVYSEMDIIVGMDSGSIPVVGTSGVPQADHTLIPANTYSLLQWPSQYFTPIPLDDPSENLYIFINVIDPQNSAGDAYNIENR